MSKTELFAKLIPLVDADPFALLGVSVSADEKEIAKRYRQIAKQLHPDAIAQSATADTDQALAAEAIARIINPSYQKLKHAKGRQEALINLRLRMRQLARTEELTPTFESTQQLAQIDGGSVDIFYEQALIQLARDQFQRLSSSPEQSLEIDQLNLIFLQRQIDGPITCPKRTGLVSTPVAAKPIATNATLSKAAAVAEATPVNSPIDYAEKHISRAKTYLSQQNYTAAVQELREALKITPCSAEIHSLIGQAYYKQNLLGMARTHFRQALKLYPTHRVAQKYGQILGVSGTTPKTTPKKPWLGRLLHR